LRQIGELDFSQLYRKLNILLWLYVVMVWLIHPPIKDVFDGCPKFAPLLAYRVGKLQLCWEEARLVGWTDREFPMVSV